MKIIRYTLLILLCLFLINLLTYFLIGKQSLRERNVSEMMKTDIYNPFDIELTYIILSNQNLDSELKLNKVTYPVISFKDFQEQNPIDSLETRIRFSLSRATADSIFNSNLDSLYQIYPEESYSMHFPSFSFSLFNNSLFRNFAISQSKRDFSIDKKLGGWCEYIKSEDRRDFLRCMVSWNEIITLEEDIKSSSIFITEQELAVVKNGYHTRSSWEEKLIWLFYRWVQIDWIDGNGLGGDIPPWKS